MPAQSNAPVVIKRKKVVQGDGHHGGAWKVAMRIPLVWPGRVQRRSCRPRLRTRRRAVLTDAGGRVAGAAPSRGMQASC